MFDSLNAPGDLGEARARLRAAAERLAPTGSLAHLDRPDRTDGIAQPGRLPSLDETVEVVVADSVLWRMGPAEIRALAEAIGSERSLVFLEPTAEVGWRRLVHRLARPLWRRSIGHDFEADLPAVLRAAGLEVVDLNRFGIGPVEIRSYALGRAVARS